MKFILEVMKIKSLIFLLAFFYHHFSYAQNRYEENWVVLDHDTMFLKKDMHKISGIVYNKHGDIGTFFQGLREGLHKEWFRNGNIKDEITFKNGMKNGEFRYWDDKGQLLKEGHYLNDSLDGFIKEWYIIKMEKCMDLEPNGIKVDINGLNSRWKTDMLFLEDTFIMMVQRLLMATF